MEGIGLSNPNPTAGSTECACEDECESKGECESILDALLELVVSGAGGLVVQGVFQGGLQRHRNAGDDIGFAPVPSGVKVRIGSREG